jgi:hypothetical protein
VETAELVILADENLPDFLKMIRHGTLSKRG